MSPETNTSIMGLVLAVFIIIIVGIAFLESIADETSNVVTNSNISGVSVTLTNMLPLFYSIGILAGCIAGAYAIMNLSGMQ